MDWIVPISESERADGALRAETAERACSTLRIHGAVLLRRLFSGDVIEQLYEQFVVQFGGLDAKTMKARSQSPAPNPVLAVGANRYDVTPQMEDAFADPNVLANPISLSILNDALGSFVRLSGFTIVISFPGSSIQHVHRDHPHLFLDGLGSVLPAFAINLSIPLVDVDLKTGPTGIWLGSHRWPEGRKAEPKGMTQIPFERGDCVMIDYRTLHAGLPNRSNELRPLIYLAYVRRWFVDELNHQNRASLNMSMETFLAYPKAVQGVLARVRLQAVQSGQTMEMFGH